MIEVKTFNLRAVLLPSLVLFGTRDSARRVMSSILDLLVDRRPTSVAWRERASKRKSERELKKKKKTRSKTMTALHFRHFFSSKKRPLQSILSLLSLCLASPSKHHGFPSHGASLSNVLSLSKGGKTIRWKNSNRGKQSACGRLLSSLEHFFPLGRAVGMANSLSSFFFSLSLPLCFSRSLEALK